MIEIEIARIKMTMKMPTPEEGGWWVEGNWRPCGRKCELMNSGLHNTETQSQTILRPWCLNTVII